MPEDFWTRIRNIYYFNNSAGEEQVGGYYKSEGSFTLVTVPKAGHFVPGDNYEAAKSFLDDYIINNSLVCRKIDGCDQFKIVQKYLNNCSDRGSFDSKFGGCICNKDYTGGDCNDILIYAREHTTVQFSTLGTEWRFFRYLGSQITDDLLFEVISDKNTPFNVYISTGK